MSTYFEDGAVGTGDEGTGLGVRVGVSRLVDGLLELEHELSLFREFEFFEDFFGFL